MHISWTAIAKQSYFLILDFLSKTRSEREVLSFIEEVEIFLNHISKHPKMFPESEKKRQVRKGYVTQDISLYYRYRPRIKEIVLLTFWDNRQDPANLIY